MVTLQWNTGLYIQGALFSGPNLLSIWFSATSFNPSTASAKLDKYSIPSQPSILLSHYLLNPELPLSLALLLDSNLSVTFFTRPLDSLKQMEQSLF